MADRRLPAQLWIAIAVSYALVAGSGVRYLEWSEVEAVIDQFAAPDHPIPDAHNWTHWIRERDREIRSRIDRGVEDSIGNLALYGTSFTRLARLAGAEAALTQQGELTPAALARVHAMALALLARPAHNERLRFAQDFLAGRGAAGPALERTLISNLRRFALEQQSYESKLREAASSGDAGRVLFTRTTLFQKRGLSVDTSLLPNYAIEDTLRALLIKNAIRPGSIRRIAVIGPGLDFTDKRDGYDFYPLQTLQPFALLDAMARLKLGEPRNIDVAVFDLNPARLRCRR